MSIAGLIIFGIAVGILSGTFGIGGGVILVPGLVLLFGFSQLEAQGTSLAVLAVPICLFAATVYYQNGYLHLPTAGWIALGFVVGAYAGARFAPSLPTSLLRIGFALLLLYVAVGYILDTAFEASLARSQSFRVLGTVVLGAIALLWKRGNGRGRCCSRSGNRSPSEWEIDFHI